METYFHWICICLCIYSSSFLKQICLKSFVCTGDQIAQEMASSNTLPLLLVVPCDVSCLSVQAKPKSSRSSFFTNSDKVAVVKDKILCSCDSQVFSKRVFEVTKKSWRFLTSKSRIWHREVGSGRTFSQITNARVQQHWITKPTMVLFVEKPPQMSVSTLKPFIYRIRVLSFGHRG